MIFKRSPSTERVTVRFASGRTASVLIQRQPIAPRAVAKRLIVSFDGRPPSSTPIADDIAEMLQRRPMAFPKILHGGI